MSDEALNETEVVFDPDLDQAGKLLSDNLLDRVLVPETDTECPD